MRSIYPAPRGPLRWVKLIVYAALLTAAQGILSRLSDAAGIPAPDLFLLTGAALVWRLPPPWAVLAAYGVGLGQDLLGSGTLGLHAAGVAGGALFTLLVRRYVADSGLFQSLLTVLMAVLGEWFTFLILNYWLRADLITADLLRTTVPLVFAGTLLLYPLWDRLVSWTFGSRSGPEEHLA
ncbi:rod shape-determining protein MreD [Deinococcus depolymerans]|uniref:Rod shape-determining protein MreD n=1 Tax=Deinococcus depolymerans TaxID=392408 RepID=A0ABN1CJK0_9DEIO